MRSTPATQAIRTLVQLNPSFNRYVPLLAQRLDVGGGARGDIFWLVTQSVGEVDLNTSIDVLKLGLRDFAAEVTHPWRRLLKVGRISQVKDIIPSEDAL
jgi:hypothetical protein